MTKAAACATAALMLAACAADPLSTSGEPAAEKRYTTGSNLPLRDRNVKVLTPEQVEQMRNSASGNTGRGPGN